VGRRPRGEVTGFVILIAQPGYLLLDNIAVRPDAQGHGIGTRLLHLAEDHARSLHLGEIRLYTNQAITENLSYCPRRGYTETHRAEQDGFHRVYFHKPDGLGRLDAYMRATSLGERTRPRTQGLPRMLHGRAVAPAWQPGTT
jgi:ribosomal protein S18 acetylase RimI-like enzyme